MAKNSDKELSMEIDENFDFIIEEYGNSSINLRKISWNGRPSKLDIRKWNYSDGKERALRGITLTDEGGDELACVLVEQNYGNTKRILEAIKKRDDYTEANSANSENINIDNSEEEYYDPSELLGRMYNDR